MSYAICVPAASKGEDLLAVLVAEETKLMPVKASLGKALALQLTSQQAS